MSFAETVNAAIADITANGYDSEERILYWMEMLRKAAEADMISASALDAQLRRVLGAAYTRLIERGAILTRHPGADRFTIERIKPKLRGELDRRIMASANLIKLNREAAIRDTLQRFSGWATSIPAGGSRAVDRPEERASLRKEMRQLRFRERRVLIDQAAKLNSALSDIIANDGGAIAAIWHSNWRQANYDYREDHKERDLRVYAIRGNWALQARLMRAGAAGYTDQITQPGEEVFCLPGDCRITDRGNLVEVAYRRWYTGDLTKVITDTGKVLRATPNHPVLTSHGWVAIGALNEGDDICQVAEEIVGPTEPHDDQSIPSIAEIFSACAEAGQREQRAGSRHQFHGDGSNSDVDVVRPDRPLWIGGKLLALQGMNEFAFAYSDDPAPTLGSLGLRDVAVLLPMPGHMRSNSQLRAAFDALAGHTNDVGRGSIATFDPGPIELIGEVLPRHAETAGESQHAQPAIVRSTRVVHVERLRYTGHVFNLQTDAGWYIADDLIVHNCRCWYQYRYNLRDLPAEMLTEKGRRALVEARGRMFA